MKHFLSIFVVLIFIKIVAAQEPENFVKERLMLEDVLDLRNLNSIDALKQSEKTMHKMFFDGWEKVTIYFDENKYIDIDSANVDLTLNKLILSKNHELFQIHESKFQKAVFQKNKFKGFKHKNKKSATQTSLFEVDIDGPLKLLKIQERSEIRTSDNPLTSAHIYKIKEVFKERIYFSIDGKSAILLPKKKTEFYKIFRGDNEKMQTYTSKNKLSIKKYPHLIQIFNYYNHLFDKSL